MKTKQEFMRAVFTDRADNAVNRSGEKAIVSSFDIIDKKTELVIVDCRVYMSHGRNAGTVYASLWVNNIKEAKRPVGWTYGSTSGNGKAGCYGYHKESAAVAAAIRSAGIELYGSPYSSPVNGDTPKQTRALLKKRAHIGGCGDGSVRCALLAIAYAAGYNDCIVS